MEKYFKNFNESKLDYTFEELNEILKYNNVEFDCYNLAYQLTAYERCGMIEYHEGLRDLLGVSFTVDDYNNFLSCNNYGIYYTFDEETFNQFFDNPWEAMRACHFGEVSFLNEYFTFNGYGNIETKSESDIINEANEDTDFIEMLLEEQHEDLFEDDFMVSIVLMALYLVKQGF